MGKNPPAIQETQVQSLGQEDTLDKDTHSSVLTWRIYRQRSLVGHSSWGSPRVGHKWATNTSESKVLLTSLPNLNQWENIWGYSAPGVMPQIQETLWAGSGRLDANHLQLLTSSYRISFAFCSHHSDYDFKISVRGVKGKIKILLPKFKDGWPRFGLSGGGMRGEGKGWVWEVFEKWLEWVRERSPVIVYVSRLSNWVDSPGTMAELLFWTAGNYEISRRDTGF